MKIKQRRGDTWLFTIFVQNNDGTAITDFTDYEAWITIKNQIADEDEDAVVQITLTGGGIVVEDAPTGKLVGTITPEVSADISTGTYYADAQIKDADGVIESTERITIEVVGDITRAL